MHPGGHPGSAGAAMGRHTVSAGQNAKLPRAPKRGAKGLAPVKTTHGPVTLRATMSLGRLPALAGNQSTEAAPSSPPRGSGPRLRVGESMSSLGSSGVLTGTTSVYPASTIVSPTQMDRKLGAIMSSAKSRAFEAEANRKSRTNPVERESPKARKQRAFKPGAAPVVGQDSQATSSTPSLHFMPELATSPLAIPTGVSGSSSFFPSSSSSGSALDPDQALAVTGKVVLDEWMDDYDNEKRCYASAIVEAEVKLGRAEVFAGQPSSPAKLPVAVAFEVLDDIAGVFGRYKSLLHRIRDLLLQAVYLDAPTPTHRRGGDRSPSAAGWADMPGTPVLTVYEPPSPKRSYHEMTPYFIGAHALSEDKQKLIEMLKKMKETVIAMETQRLNDVSQTKAQSKVVDVWKRVMTENKYMREVDSLTQALVEKVSKIEELSAAHLATIDRVTESFESLDELSQQIAVSRMIQLMPERWGVLGRWMLGVMPKEQTFAVARDSIVTRDEVSINDVVRFQASIIQSDKVKGSLIGQTQVAREAILSVDDLTPVLPAICSRMTVSQQRGLVRVLAGVDTGLMQESVLNDYLAAQPDVELERQRYAERCRRAEIERRHERGELVTEEELASLAGKLPGDAPSPSPPENSLDGGKSGEAEDGEGENEKGKVPEEKRDERSAQVQDGDAAGKAATDLDTSGVSGGVGDAEGKMSEGESKQVDAPSSVAEGLPSGPKQPHSGRDASSAAASATHSAGHVSHRRESHLSDEDVPYLYDAVPEHVRTPEAGMFDPLLGSLTRYEKAQLLSDLLVDLGREAWEPIAAQLVDKESLLHEAMDRSDDTTREHLIDGLCSNAPQWMVCKSLVCPHHDHEVTIPAPRTPRQSPTKTPIKSPEWPATPVPESPVPPGLVPPVPRAYLPLVKFTRKPPKGVRWRSRDILSTINLMYDCYEKKIKEDITELAAGVAPEDLMALPDFVQQYLMQKYGLPSLSEAHMYGIVEATQRLSDASSRLSLFGRMIGVLKPRSYTPRLAAVVLHLMRLVYPRFTANVLRTNREGRCPILLSTALAAAGAVFTDYAMSVSFEKLRLTNGRREALFQELTLLSEPYGTAMPKMSQAAESHAAFLMDFDTVAEEGRRKEMAGAGGVGSGTAASAAHGTDKRHTFEASDVVIDFDRFMETCLCYWELQGVEDMAQLRNLFFEFCGDQYQRLSYPSFCKLILTIAPSKLYTQRQLTAMFKQINSLDDIDSNDAISPEMFISFCRHNGFVAPPPA